MQERRSSVPKLQQPQTKYYREHVSYLAKAKAAFIDNLAEYFILNSDKKMLSTYLSHGILLDVADIAR